MKTRPSISGFTLLELVLVLVVLSVALAAVAPSLHGWNRGAKVRDAGDQFLALARYARSQALADATIYRLNVDAQNGRYWLTVQDGQQFAKLGNEFGRVFTLPDGFGIRVTDDATASRPLEAIDFFPSGRTQVAHVLIASGDGNERVDLECPTPAEGLRLASAQEPKR